MLDILGALFPFLTQYQNRTNKAIAGAILTLSSHFDNLSGIKYRFILFAQR